MFYDKSKRLCLRFMHQFVWTLITLNVIICLLYHGNMRVMNEVGAIGTDITELNNTCSNKEYELLSATLESLAVACSSYSFETLTKKVNICDLPHTTSDPDCYLKQDILIDLNKDNPVNSNQASIKFYVNKISMHHDNVKQPLCSHFCCETLHKTYIHLVNMTSSCFDRLNADKHRYSSSLLDCNVSCFKKRLISSLNMISKEIALNKIIHYRANIAKYCKGFQCYWNHEPLRSVSNHNSQTDTDRQELRKVGRDEYEHERGINQKIKLQTSSNKETNESQKIHDLQYNQAHSTTKQSFETDLSQSPTTRTEENIVSLEKNKCNEAHLLQSLSMNLKLSCMQQMDIVKICSNPKCCSAIIQYQYVIEQLPFDSPCFDLVTGSKASIFKQLQDLKEKMNSNCIDGEFICLGRINSSEVCSHGPDQKILKGERQKVKKQQKLENLEVHSNRKSIFEKKVRVNVNSNSTHLSDSLLLHAFHFYQSCKYHSESFCSPECCKALNLFEKMIQVIPEFCYVSPYDIELQIEMNTPIKENATDLTLSMRQQSKEQPFDQSRNDLESSATQTNSQNNEESKTQYRNHEATPSSNSQHNLQNAFTSEPIRHGIILDLNGAEGDASIVTNDIPFNKKLSREFLKKMLERKRRLINTQCVMGCYKMF